MNTLQTAQFWKKLGIACIPIRYRDKRPALPEWGYYQSILPSDTELLQWFSKPFINIAIITGWRNLVIIDFDSDTEYERWLLWIARRQIYRFIRQTLIVRSARGYHVYITTRQPAQNAKLPGIDIKARGGYVLTPPSIHPSGVPYQVVSGDLPLRIEALSDILPPELLASHTELPKPVLIPTLSPQNSDPWDSAENLFQPGKDLIQKIKDNYRIESFFKRLYGKNSRWKMTHCPFHNDSNPSFWIDTKRQLCGCFAGCTLQPYDVIDLYARLHNLSVKDAIWILRN